MYSNNDENMIDLHVSIPVFDFLHVYNPSSFQLKGVILGEKFQPILRWVKVFEQQTVSNKS